MHAQKTLAILKAPWRKSKARVLEYVLACKIHDNARYNYTNKSSMTKTEPFNLMLMSRRHWFPLIRQNSYKQFEITSMLVYKNRLDDCALFANYCKERI